jgi:hypothetical protein
MKNSSTRILTVAVIVLLLANLALVYFIMTGRKGYDRREGRKDPMEMMIKELKMSEKQEADFRSMKDEHFKNVRPLFDSMRAAKNYFFSLIKDTTVSDSAIQTAEQKALDQQRNVDMMTFDHFKRVRALFTAEQLPKYDSFINKMMDRRRGSTRDSSKEKHDQR